MATNEDRPHHSTLFKKKTDSKYFVFFIHCRYDSGLDKVYRIGIRKGVLLGLCQAVMNITIGLIFALAAWYGPYLLRSECAGE